MILVLIGTHQWVPSDAKANQMGVWDAYPRKVTHMGLLGVPSRILLWVSKSIMTASGFLLPASVMQLGHRV